jgi:hypothetical protein
MNKKERIMTAIGLTGLTTIIAVAPGCTNYYEQPKQTPAKTTQVPESSRIINTPIIRTPVVRAPETKTPVQTTAPTLSPTPSPKPIETTPANPLPRSFVNGGSGSAENNDIIVGDTVIDEVVGGNIIKKTTMYDSLDYTGLVTVNKSGKQVWVEFPYGGSIITIYDDAKRQAETNNQEQIMVNQGKQAQEIDFYGGPNQRTQTNPGNGYSNNGPFNWLDGSNTNKNYVPNGDYNPNRMFRHGRYFEVEPNYEDNSVPFHATRIEPNGKGYAGPEQFFVGDEITATEVGGRYPKCLTDNDPKTRVCVDFSVYTNFTTASGGFLVGVTKIEDKYIIEQNYMQKVREYSEAGNNKLTKISLLPFYGGWKQPVQK